MNEKSSASPQSSFSEGIVSASNHDVAMKTLFEQQIEDLIVKEGHAEKGDLVVEIVDNKLVVKSTKGNDVEAIFKKAFPEEAEQALKVRTPHKEKPMNREQRRANKKNHGRRGKSFYR